MGWWLGRGRVQFRSDRESVKKKKSVDLGGRRVSKKKKKKNRKHTKHKSKKKKKKKKKKKEREN
ncbi:hypothetical protein, partial [Tenacibaculum discolor]|uniref:hypothetical protein n=1 Tax=Tenacibaculum discolor TaxID=361581 RepID=UPI001F349A5E